LPRSSSGSAITSSFSNNNYNNSQSTTSPRTPTTTTTSPMSNTIKSELFSIPMTPSTEYQVFMVMEYCDASMDQLITDYFDYISLEQKLNWLRQAAQVLQFLHNKFIVHRDLKPQNFLLKATTLANSSTTSPTAAGDNNLSRTPSAADPNGLLSVLQTPTSHASELHGGSSVQSTTGAATPSLSSVLGKHLHNHHNNNNSNNSNNNNADIVDPSQDYTLKLVDFGFTKQSATMMKSFAGTPLYMSPECYNTRKYDVSTDIWSFGIVILRLTVFPVRSCIL